MAKTQPETKEPTIPPESNENQDPKEPIENLEAAVEEIPQEPAGPSITGLADKLISIANDRADHFKEGRIMNKEEIATLQALEQVYITLRMQP